jgi:hypothetical protein
MTTGNSPRSALSVRNNQDGPLDTTIEIISRKDRTPAAPAVSSKLETIASSAEAAQVPNIEGTSVRANDESSRTYPDQKLFEARLQEGIVIRKINSHGKSHLRTVRCVYVVETTTGTPSRGSASASSSRHSNASSISTTNSPLVRKYQTVSAQTSSSQLALAWGKRKDSNCKIVPADCFRYIRKGKTTDRSRKNPAPSNRILTVVTHPETQLPSLDIETPTTLDRDKFAKAFGMYLKIPVLEEDVHAAAPVLRSSIGSGSASGRPPSVGGGSSTGKPPMASTIPTIQQDAGGAHPPPLFPVTANTSYTAPPANAQQQQHPQVSSYNSASSRPGSSSHDGAVLSVVEGEERSSTGDSASDVSTITGHAYDHELVEELHQALNEMRVELEESRAEASRAVKVAEQAIQSAERSNSAEWQNTVTHKAAEAAAQAQKRSAEAMARQRVAEERLEQEKRTAIFWKKQAELAEEEAGTLQTRAAVAEVQRATMEEQLESESRTHTALIDLMQRRLTLSENIQKDALEACLERNRVLEVELAQVHRHLDTKLEDAESWEERAHGRKRMSFSRKQKSTSESNQHLLSNKTSSTKQMQSQESGSSTITTAIQTSTEQIVKIHAEAAMIREQFELLRRMTSDELSQIPVNSQQWTEQMKSALIVARDETKRLRRSLALESASRRLLQHEVQDLRGMIRVYCIPRSVRANDKMPLLSFQSHETVTLHRERIPGVIEPILGPISFEFDRVFQPNATQQDVYIEIEEVILGVLEGYNICVMAYGQSGCGKTHALLGDIGVTDDSVSIQSKGIQLMALEQLFSVADNRKDRYNDTFSLSVLEVCNERISDLLAGTSKADQCGGVINIESSVRKKKNATDDDLSSKHTKLEIRTDIHGETVVQGLLSMQISNFEDVCCVWKECLENRRARLVEQGNNPTQYDSECHVIATLKVRSKNVATGLESVGKIQFVDLAGANLVPGQASVESKAAPSLQELTSSVSGDNNSCWKFENRSIQKFAEVIAARSQYARSVPYRNSTLTHLISDSLEHDAKVVLLACISADVKDAQETASALRLASRARRVWIGKATKHSIEFSPPN